MGYELIKRNFERGLWSVEAVFLAVKKGIITNEQFEEITGYRINKTK